MPRSYIVSTRVAVTIYHYIDESVQKRASYCHCSIGGALVDAAKVVDVEVALEDRLHRLAKAELPSLGAVPEFKYTAFFRQAPDSFKLRVCQELAATLVECDIQFLVSQSSARTVELSIFKAQSPDLSIQLLSYFNLVHYLAPYAEKEVVQVIVDLGFSDAFRPLYDIYSNGQRILPTLKAQGLKDEDISIRNYRNLPVPVFLGSRDSRLLQCSDLVIGLWLARRAKILTPFKASLLDALSPLQDRVLTYNVEWNSEASPGSEAAV